MLAMRSAFRAKDRVLKNLAELQIRIMQLQREGSPPPGLRLPQAKLSRKSNQVARGRIRRFESYMPSQPVRHGYSEQRRSSELPAWCSRNTIDPRQEPMAPPG